MEQKEQVKQALSMEDVAEDEEAQMGSDDVVEEGLGWAYDQQVLR